MTPASPPAALARTVHSTNLARLARAVLACVLVAGLAACGGSAAPGSDEPSPGTTVNPPGAPAQLWAPAAESIPAGDVNAVIFERSDSPSGTAAAASQRGFIYTNRDAAITVTSAPGRLTVTVLGDETWFGEMQAPASVDRLALAYYEGLETFPTHDPSKGGLRWWGELGPCTDTRGWLAIDQATYGADGQLTSIRARFEKRCTASGETLRGFVRWRADDATQPAGPAPVPPELWRPAADAGVPATGNYLLVQGEAGSSLAPQGVQVIDAANARIDATSARGRVALRVRGDAYWDLTLQAMSSLEQLKPGYYAQLQRFPVHNPARGGMDVSTFAPSGKPRRCARLQGWLAVDAVRHDALGAVQFVEARFEQRCEGDAGVLRGQLRWDAAQAFVANRPQLPPPTGLWESTAAIPTSGNAFVVASQGAAAGDPVAAPADPVGQGLQRVYTTADAVFDVTVDGAAIAWNVFGDERWRARFAPMDGLSRLEPGYYASLARVGVNNPMRGALQVFADDRTCLVTEGWVVVDAVSHDSTGALESIDLRFEQRCDGVAAPLNGRLRWSAADTAVAAGPVLPAPPTLWSAPGDRLPTTGSYVYLESDAQDPVGLGASLLLTRADASLRVSSPVAGLLTVAVNSASGGWRGDFRAMQALSGLQVGYYPGLGRYPLHNPARGGLQWSALDRTCGAIDGWFAIDSITFDAQGALASVKLRFEQRCEGASGSLRGQLRWTAGE